MASVLPESLTRRPVFADTAAAIPRPWLGWLPLLLLVPCVLVFGDRVTAWVLMWSLAVAIFAGLKWWTWWNWRCQVAHPAWRSVAYLLAWPGMNAASFLGRPAGAKPRFSAWLGAFCQTALGVVLLWFVARAVPVDLTLFRGWVGMVGAVLALHFGVFKIAALFWQAFGVDAEPIMSAPLRSRSLSEFWGRRWNLGFRQLAHDLVFVPMHKKLGPRSAGFLVFLVSGLIHDLVISLPARAGFGLPTLYFCIQGAGVAMERSPLGRRLGLREGVRGWLFMALATGGPLVWLFHPPFVRHVILPMMEAMHTL